jgi:anthranilate phosphoribosyltransferase
MRGERSDAAMRAGLVTLLADRDLSRDEIEAVFAEIIAGECDPAQIGALLFALARKGETAEEIAGAAAAMRRAVLRVPTRHTEILDTCGTGGSGVSRRNVSTAVALAVAACGVVVAKHGNRAASGPSGSADVLEALGVDIHAEPDEVGRDLDEVGIGFLFAPRLHPAMRHAAGPRRALAVRTIFNLLGPLTNPAGANRQLLGVYDPRKCRDLAAALGALGSRRVLVVHGFREGVTAGPDSPPGIDDASPEGETLVEEWRDGRLHGFVVRPEDAGLSRVPLSALAGGVPAENAAAVRRLLAGEKGAYRTAVQLSGALALLAAGDGDLDELPAYAEAIGRAIDEGRAAAVLANLVARGHDGRR